MKKLLFAAFLGISLFWACHLGPEDESDHFDIVGDSTWTLCDTLVLILEDDSGRVLDTLFRNPLRSLSQLKGLDAGSYRGGQAALRVHGFYRDGSPCLDLVRSFSDDGSPPSVETIYDAFALPDSVIADPPFLSLVGDGGPQKVKGRVLPAHVDQELFWSLDSSGVASLDLPPNTPSKEAMVSPEALGEGYLTLRSRKDPGKSARVRVRVSPIAATSVFLDDDSLLLYARGPSAVLAAVVLPHLADPAVAWFSGDTSVARVDTSGRVYPVAEGRTVIRAVTGNGLKDSAVVTVVRDVPKLKVAHKPGAPVNEVLSFTPTATQKVGHLTLYAWDLQGDGVWEDSLTLQLFGDSVVLPQQVARYAAEGEYRPRFRVRDSEGNTAIAEVVIFIGNQPPEIDGLPGDTVLSIRDSIPMTAIARDLDGKVVWAGWDYEGDRQFDDTLIAFASEVRSTLGHRYMQAGSYLAVFRAIDDLGRESQDTVRIRVELDPPITDAGPDIVAIANEALPVHVGGSDRLGTIVRREYKLGDGPYTVISGTDTVIQAPPEPAELKLVVRVTDDDSLTAVDTAKVSVILSANSDLSDLVISAGSLAPAFRPDVGNYAAQVGYGDSLVHIVATTRDPAAELTVNGLPAVSGVPVDPIRIGVGPNPGAFLVRVASPDGSMRTYSVSVMRTPSTTATLKSLTGTGFILRPAFDPGTLEYLDTVPYAVSAVTLRPAASFPGATVTVDGAIIASGTPTPALPLQFGLNIFRIEVTAEDGMSRTTYTIGVLRLAKLYIYRKLGPADAVLADSMELPLGAVRPLSSAGITGHTFAAWRLLGGRATLEDTAVNPTFISVGTGSAQVQAAYTINRYTLTASSTGCGTLNPAPGTADYNHGVNVAYALSPAAGCRISSVRVDGVEDTSGYDGSLVFLNLSASHTLQVRFARYYTLSGAIVGSGGTMWPTAAVRVDSGSGYTYTFKPDNGKKVYSFKDNGVLVAPTPTTSYSLQNITANHHGEVIFAGGFTLTARVALGSGTITPEGAAVDSGGSQTFRFRPAANYRFLSLTDNGAAAAPSPGDTQYTLTAINRAHALEVRFRRLYSLSVAARGCGTVNGAGGLVDSASSPSFTFAPASGCKIDSVFVNNASIGPANGYTFNAIAQNSSLRVVFTRVFTVATYWGTGAAAEDRVGGTVNPANPQVDSMDAVTLNLGASIGYRRQSLTVNNVAVTPVPTTYTFPAVRGNQTLRQGLIRTFTQTASVAGGQGTVSPTLATVDTLGSQTFVFTPAAHYRVPSLLVNGAAVTPSGAGQHVLTGINRDNALQVRFLRQYTIAVTSSGCGTVTPSGSAAVDSAANQAFTFNLPNVACTVDTLFVDGQSVTPAAGYTFTRVVANHSMRVVFNQDPLTQTVTTTWGTAGDNRVGGSITPANPSVTTGQPVTLAINVAAGYRRQAFSVNGTPITPVPNSYTIPSVTAPMAVHATFLRTFVQTGVVGLGAGSITPTSETIDTAGSLTFAFAPAANYRFLSLLVNGAEVTPSGTGQHVLTGINRDNTVQVRFRRQYTITTSATGCGTVPAGGVRDSASNNNFIFTVPAGCKVDSLIVNGIPVAPATSYAFNNLSQDQTLHAEFWRVFRVTGTAGTGGTVTPAQSEVDSAESISLTIAPASGYVIDTVWDNGVVRITDGGSAPIQYAINGIRADHQVTASFRRPVVTYTFNVSVTGQGSASPSTGSVTAGADQRIVFTAGSGFVLTRLTDNDRNVLGDIEGNPAGQSSYTLLRVGENHQIRAEFERSQGEGYRLSVSDSVVLGMGELPPEKPPELYVVWVGQGASDSSHGNPVTMSIPMGSDVTVTAQESVEVCDDDGVCGVKQFSHWHVRTSRGESDAQGNPWGFKMNSEYEIRAVYGAGPIRIPASAPEP